MRKVFLGFLITLGLTIFVFAKKPAIAPENSSSSKITATPTSAKSDQVISLEGDGVTTQIAWVKVPDLGRFFLYPNFKERLSTQELLKQEGCQSLVSAGFYTKENEPIGLFITEGEQIKNRVESRLFDGIFSVDRNNEAKISLQTPQENVRLALQSGPVLIKDGKVLKLQIKEDKSARRVVLALNKTGEVYFLAIFNKDSVFEGPLLAELPRVVKSLEEKMDVEFLDALNLDGGSASAFYSDFLSLSELTPIGSFFCIR